MHPYKGVSMHNIRLIDRVIRIVLGLILIYFSKGSFDLYTIIALFLFASSFMGFCPSYALLGINREFAKKNNFLEQLPMHNPEPVFVFCPKGSVVFRNSSAKKILPKIQHFLDISENKPKDIIQKESYFSVKYPNNETIYMLEVIGFKDKKYILAYGYNITDIEKSKQELKTQLITDALTGLGNRNRLVKNIEENKDSPLILMVFDIIKFSQINSLFGHDKGDLFLQNFAKALLSIKKELNKVHSAYRLRGNTFALLIECSSTQSTNKNRLIQQIQSRLEELLHSYSEKSENLSTNIDLRIGLSNSIPSRANSIYSLLNQAETALSEAKKESLHVLDFNDIKEINERYKENLYWVSKLKSILANQSKAKFCTHFQPIYNLNTQKIEKFECLVRIEEDGKTISPFAFLEVAKQIEALPDITKHVLKSALETFQGTAYEFSINITTQDLDDKNFCSYLEKLCKTYNIAPQRVVLEILEDEDIYQFTQTITKLKEYGLKIAIDDFGVGYSNFKKLQMLNADYIKIDGSLVKNIAKNKKDFFVIQSICTYAKAIGVKTIAEFVADRDIFHLLQKVGVDYTQGYYIGAPKPDIEVDFHD